jgi:hypothetical protein
MFHEEQGASLRPADSPMINELHTLVGRERTMNMYNFGRELTDNDIAALQSIWDELQSFSPTDSLQLLISSHGDNKVFVSRAGMHTGAFWLRDGKISFPFARPEFGPGYQKTYRRTRKNWLLKWATGRETPTEHYCTT